MAFCEMHFWSESLGRQSACSLIVPQQAGPWATLYLLHGYSDDHTIWMRRTSLERYVDGWPLLVVLPNGGNSFYSDAQAGEKHESALVNDLMGFIETTFPVRRERGGRAIGGLSMGGYGAIKLALKHPGLFASAHSHSGALDLASMMQVEQPDIRQAVERIFGPSPLGGEDDPSALAERLALQAGPTALPALKIDCGHDDFLLEQNRTFHAHLERIGLAHRYEEHPGAHTWEYWDTHIREALLFHREHLHLSTA